jgi:hypothetical protein
MDQREEAAQPENGLVRILSTPAYADPPETPANVIVRLQQFCASGHHEFWRIIPA